MSSPSGRPLAISVGVLAALTLAAPAATRVQGDATPITTPSHEMLTNSAFTDLEKDGAPTGWELLTPSETSAPKLQVARGPAGTRWAKLTMKKHGGCYGNLQQRVEPLTPGQWVRIRCTVRAAKGVDPRYNALVRLPGGGNSRPARHGTAPMQQQAEAVTLTHASRMLTPVDSANYRTSVLTDSSSMRNSDSQLLRT